jgi:hypothetical protein
MLTGNERHTLGAKEQPAPTDFDNHNRFFALNYAWCRWHRPTARCAARHSEPSLTVRLVSSSP